MKRCPKCTRELVVESFGICRREPDGRQTYCRDCRRAYREENRARIAAKKRADYEANRRQVIERVRAHYERNRNEIIRERRARYAADPEPRLAENRARQVKVAGASATEIVRRKVVFERDGGICQLCDQPVDPADFHVDHIVPLAAGGEHSYANVWLTHPRCNLVKGIRPLEALAL